jgi:hypothetical protein
VPVADDALHGADVDAELVALSGHAVGRATDVEQQAHDRPPTLEP